jgi:hypothetical protein
MSKVFCSQCSNYSPSSHCWTDWDDFSEKCLAPENYADTYLCSKGKLCNTPEVQNKDNDCSWFKVKIKKKPFWKIFIHTFL